MTETDHEQEASVMGAVDAHPLAHQPTETDEGQVLTGLYGDPDADGFHTGGEL